jgi:hypothetical protein
MAVEPQNLIQIQSDLQNPSLVTNETLLKYANGTNPQVPSFLALLEMNRRKQIDEGSKSFEASSQASVKDQIASQLTQPTQTASGMTGIPFNTNPAAAPRGIDPTANPFGKNIAQTPMGINPTAAPMQPNTAPIQPITGAAGGLMSLPVDHFKPQSYAGGGIVAFQSGGLNDEEKRLSSFPEEQASRQKRLSDAQIVEAMRAAGSAEAPVAQKAPAPGSYQAILAGLPSLQAPEEKTDEVLFAERKAREKMAGVSEDPYSDVKARQSKREARQEQNYEQAGMDRLIAQLSAFAQADPSRGFGYAGAVSSDASEKLEAQQNALRDKEESAQIEFQRAVAKEEDSRRRNDADGVAAAQKDQQKAKFDYAKAEQDRGVLAANIFNVMEDSRNQRESNANSASYQKGMLDYYKRMADISEATKPSADDVLYNRIIAKAENDATIKMLAKKQEQLDVGTPEYNAIEMEKYRRMATYFDKRPDLMPPKPNFPAPKEDPKKDDLAWWQVRSRMERDKKQKNTIPKEWSVTPIPVE